MEGGNEFPQQRQQGRHNWSDNGSESYHLIITYFMTCLFHFLLLLIIYHAEFHDNVWIAIFLQKMYSFLYTENLFVKEGSCVWNDYELIGVWDGIFYFRDCT